MSARIVRWYMGRVAGRYCPCEWPVKIRPLIRLCGRIDDANERLDFIAFARWYMASQRRNTTSTTATTVDVQDWKVGGP